MKFNTKNLTITNSYANYEVLENDVTTNIEITWSFKNYNNLTNEVNINLEIDEAVQYDDDVTINIKLTDQEKKALFEMVQDEVEQDASEYGLCEWLDTEGDNDTEYRLNLIPDEFYEF
jgi:antibiotic biosynthesis monooxygenase (ABM) superfamily enzyme